jgi:IS5 family transposase
MLAKSNNRSQGSLFSSLVDLIDARHPLVLLGDTISWEHFETAFKKHYSEKMGKPAKPIRLMVSLLILK